MNVNFNQPHILPQHQIPLTTAVTACCPGQAALISRLYKTAFNVAMGGYAFHTDPTQLLDLEEKDGGKDDNTCYRSATATDNQTGYFVQIKGTVDDLVSGTWLEGPLLAVGKKFAQEIKPPQLNNTAVKLWC